RELNTGAGTDPSRCQVRRSVWIQRLTNAGHTNRCCRRRRKFADRLPRAFSSRHGLLTIRHAPRPRFAERPEPNPEIAGGVVYRLVARERIGSLLRSLRGLLLAVPTTPRRTEWQWEGALRQKRWCRSPVSLDKINDGNRGTAPWRLDYCERW